LVIDGLFHGYGKLDGLVLDAGRLSVRKKGRSAAIEVPGPKTEELAAAIASVGKWSIR
jgi:hypothetical protein